MEKRTRMRLMPLLDSHFEEEVLVLPDVHWHLSISFKQFIARSFSFLLSFVLLLNAIGYYPLFQLKQWQVHQEMKSHIRSTLPDEQLQCIAVSTTDDSALQWQWEWEEEQEFTYRGSRYDVVRSMTQADSIYYYCIQDTQETELFAELEQDVERQMNDEKDPLQRTAKKIIKTLSGIILTTDDEDPITSRLTSQQLFSFQYCLYHYDYFYRISPPPKHVT